MKRFVVIMGLISFVLANQTAEAQNYRYVAPGYEYNYYSGINLGYGVGYGYGLGIEILLPVGALVESPTPMVQPVQYSNYDDVSLQSSSDGDFVFDTYVPVKPKSKAQHNTKKSTSKVPSQKTNSETKLSKSTSHPKTKVDPGHTS